MIRCAGLISHGIKNFSNGVISLTVDDETPFAGVIILLFSLLLLFDNLFGLIAFWKTELFDLSIKQLCQCVVPCPI